VTSKSKEIGAKSSVTDEKRPVPSTYEIVFVPRARKIHQSLFSTPFSALSCLIASLPTLASPNTTTDAATAARFLDSQRDMFRKRLKNAEAVEAKGKGGTQSKMQAHLAKVALSDLDLAPEPPESTLKPEQQQELDYSFPALVLANGPGTAGIVIAGCLLLRVLDWRSCDSRLRSLRTVYVESWARVKRMSLTGRLVRPFVDRCLVQWEQLQGKGTEYRGVLV
jgi:hypothetical protein